MYIDTHAHTYLKEFKEDLIEVVGRSKKVGVEKVLLPNIDTDSIRDVLKLSNDFPGYFYPMLGLHPCSVDESFQETLDRLEAMLDEFSFIAIGETGIDLYWDNTFIKEQEMAFRTQVRWAKELGLPVVIHSRNSIEHTIRIIDEEQDGSLKGVFHCFGEDLKKARTIMDLGFYMGIGGVVTFKKSVDLRETLKLIGLDFIVLETDAPYLSPMPYRGKRNESSYLEHIAKTISAACEITIEEVAAITRRNALQLFNL